MVHEWNDVFVPAWQIAVDLHGHELCQPGDVLDLLLSQFDEGIEATEVETIFESLREASGLLLEHDLIDGLSLALSLMSIVISN
mgnify:CR=1 FL=1